mmetsp:Transcript_19235/g.24787  ORF Transcript_19235/g.24787 Transcript_19235/m.24787 type:complete len:254 (-) Transcript_19235:201-962(-)|eukprot:CAMPEP_0198152606 /NCGR_PEP_ID=MMETSP1443-20131203/60523_1 /TAXON_ID=186043 /ORGANISM="Entomoneis sp., Strain CCMP2396" /LENGTH=253 /DNA_ID=CAMNT_0043818683 /DNA_START=94 /DNA_END=855 /DNA_ORIENTATION=-
MKSIQELEKTRTKNGYDYVQIQYRTRNFASTKLPIILLLSILFLIEPVQAFAAKKPSRKKNAATTASTTTRGFGAKPLTFAQVVQDFETRLPSEAKYVPCPCCLDIGNVERNDNLPAYQDCCAPYHSGDKQPQSPERVLRSRYSAFCWRLIPYVIQTTHEDASEYSTNRIQWAKELNKRGMFDDYTFVNLEIMGDTLFENDEETEATLEFQVRLRSTTGSGQVEETLIRENSIFRKSNDGWLYVDGKVNEQTE